MIKFITVAISPEGEALVLGEKPDGRYELDVLLWGLATCMRCTVTEPRW